MPFLKHFRFYDIFYNFLNFFQIFEFFSPIFIHFFFFHLLCRWNVNWTSWPREILQANSRSSVWKEKPIDLLEPKCPNICSQANVELAKRIDVNLFVFSIISKYSIFEVVLSFLNYGVFCINKMIHYQRAW